MNTTTTEAAAKRRTTTTTSTPPATGEEPGPSATDKDRQGRDEPPRRDPRVGPIVGFATAAVVFAIGQMLMPPSSGRRKPTTPAVTAPTPAPAVAPPPVAAAPAVPAPAAPTEPGAAPAAPLVQPARSNPLEKDVAREAWRKNLPDISDDPRRASLLIPLRGSIDGATYHFIEKQKGVVLTLPHAESMITMPFYRLKHDSFRTLWIKQGGGEPTSIRLMLGATVIKPEVEIKDGFARVTVTKTAAATRDGTAPANDGPAPAKESAAPAKL